jgi:VWFA-related protein
MSTCFRPGIAAVAALTTLGVSLTPQAAQRESTEGVELVTLDFRGLGENGEPAPDLKPTDLSLKIDGKSRDIRSLRFVRTADPEPADGAAGEDAPAPPAPFGTNHLTDAGRAILLIIENESLRPDTSRPTLDASGRFVRMLAPSDRVALITMPRGGVLVDFTTNHTKVMEALDTVSGQGSASTSTTDHACRTRDTLNALTSLFDGIAASPGPKTVVFVSAGLLRPTRDAPLLGPPGRCEVQSKAFDDVGFAADAARVHFYAIRPEDLVVDSALTAVVDPTASRFRNTDEEVAGLESLAGVAGGEFMRLLRGDDSPFARIVRETSGHYMLSFEAERGERNGKNHRVELRTSRADVTLRARDRIIIPKPPSKSSLTPQAMVRDRKAAYTDLPVRVAGYASANPGDTTLKIIALLEPVDRSVQLSSAVFGLFDQKGKLVAQWTANERELSGNPVMSAGLVEPGEYQLRAAAVDATGRRGAAEYALDAHLMAADPLTISAMVLGVSRGGSFLPKMFFESDPTAMGFLEIYGNPGSGALDVALELAPSEDGRAIVRVPASVNAGQDPGRRTANGVVPIGALSPGDYVVRAIVSLDGRPIGRVHRTLRKGIR